MKIFLNLSQKANFNPSQQACTRSKIQKPKQGNTKAHKKKLYNNQKCIDILCELTLTHSKYNVKVRNLQKFPKIVSYEKSKNK